MRKFLVLGTALFMAGCSNTTAPEVTPETSGSVTTTTTIEQALSCPAAPDVDQLFQTWNAALATGDPAKVAELYAEDAVLLPTVSEIPRLTQAEREDYFAHWLPNHPDGVVTERWTEKDCNRVIDAGAYTFTYADGTVVPARYTFVYTWDGQDWKISTHHSSAMPEDGASTDLTVATPVEVKLPEPETCTTVDEATIAAQFDEWNTDLQEGTPMDVAANYADNSLLLPTVSNKLRFSAAEKADYFEHFQEKHPVGTIDKRWIDLGCDTAVDSGLYTFTYDDGTATKARYTYTYRWDGKEWVITSHHSSKLPNS